MVSAHAVSLCRLLLLLLLPSDCVTALAALLIRGMSVTENGEIGARDIAGVSARTDAINKVSTTHDLP